MRAQVSLTTSESKKLIAKAIANMDFVQKALAEGIIALHPSSNTFFLVEELLGRPPETEVWVMGMIVPKGACGSAAGRASHKITTTADGKPIPRGPAGYLCTWVIEKGNLHSGIPLQELIDRMGPRDVYVKGVTTIDYNNKAAVLIGNPVEGGTIGLVMSNRKKKGFHLVLPAGLEKLIPIPVEEAAKEAANRSQLAYSMGMPCSLLPCDGIVVNEPIALHLLTGTKATPICGGGMGGAEGAVTMVIQGTDSGVQRAIEIIEGLKGTQLPRKVVPADCMTCDVKGCSLRGGNKHWI